MSAADSHSQARASASIRSLNDPWQLGGVTIPNRVVLAPLAGIGNWFVRLQAKRYGAGLAVSEMVSSHAIHYGNRKTLDELPVVNPHERTGGPGGIEGFSFARRLVEDAGVAGLTFHPRSAAVRHKGTPDYALATRLVEELPVPVIVSGGMEGAEHVRAVFESTGCAAVMLARGALGNPWLFAQVLETRTGEPSREEVLEEWRWVLDRAVEHLGPDRAARYLRKFHPWYVERLGAGKAVRAALQQADTIAEQRAVIEGLQPLLAAS